MKNLILAADWGLFFQPLPIFFLLDSIILTGIVLLLWNKRQQQDFIPGPEQLGATNRSLKQFYGFVPLILGIHVALALLINGAQGRLFFSHYPLEKVWSNGIGFVEIMIALSFFYGGLTRPAAAILGCLWILGIWLIGLLPMMKSIQYLGYACFFYLAGRGPYAIDRVLFPALEPKENYTNYALLLLRLGIGLNIMILGFASAVPLLENFSFIKTQGKTFALLAGAIEVLGGLLITFGIFPRTVALLALICINTSLTIYNLSGLIDFFPMIAGLAILLVWEPSNPKQKLLWVEGIREGMEEIDYNGTKL